MSIRSERLDAALGYTEGAAIELDALHRFAHDVSQDKSLSKNDRAIWNAISLSAGVAACRIQKADSWLDQLASDRPAQEELL